MNPPRRGILVSLLFVLGAESCSRKDLRTTSDGMGLLIPERCTTLSVDGDESIISDGTLIAALEGHPTLKSLSLDREPRRAALKNSQLTSEAMQGLVGVLPSTKLTYLSVSYNPVGDEGLRAVTNVLADTTIDTLWFKEAEVSNKGVIELMKVLKEDKTVLRRLDFSHNQDITETVLDHLVTATKGHSKLAFVGLEGSEAGVTDDKRHAHLSTLLSKKCVMGDWGEWSTCNADKCGATGEMKRFRSVLHAPISLKGGGSCGESVWMVKNCQMKCNKDSRDGRFLATGGFKMGPERLVEVDTPKPGVPSQPILSTKSSSSSSSPLPSKSSVSAESPSARFATKAAETSPKQPEAAEPDTAPATRLRSSSQATPKVDTAPKTPNPPEPELGLGLPAHKKIEKGGSSADVPSANAPAAASREEADSASNGEPAPKLRKAPSTPRDFHTRLTAFYQQYNPSKTGSVKSMLMRYQGREEVLFSNLVSKYGPEPIADEDVTAAKESSPATPSGNEDGEKKANWAW